MKRKIAGLVLVVMAVAIIVVGFILADLFLFSIFDLFSLPGFLIAISMIGFLIASAIVFLLVGTIFILT